MEVLTAVDLNYMVMFIMFIVSSNSRMFNKKFYLYDCNYFYAVKSNHFSFFILTRAEKFCHHILASFYLSC
jgi:hypothetical protein